MSDQLLREFERRFNETGSPGDELEWLRALYRHGGLSADHYFRLAELDPEGATRHLESRHGAGHVSQSSLELAAWCRHGPAERLLEGREREVELWDRPYRQIDRTAVPGLVEGLEQFGGAPLLLGLRALASGVCALWAGAAPEIAGEAEELSRALAALLPDSASGRPLLEDLHARITALAEEDYRVPLTGRSLSRLVLGILYLPAAFHVHPPDGRMTEQRVFGAFGLELEELSRRLPGAELALYQAVTARVCRVVLYGSPP